VTDFGSESVHRGHGGVHHNDIRLTRRDLFNGFLPISRLANNLEIIIGYQKSAQGLAYSPVIVN
jgi:hypothetical protein